MSEKTQIGGPLLETETRAQIGYIRFDPSGMLIYQLIKPGLHANEFKPIHHLLTTQWLSAPLYRKHASLLDENSKLPKDILLREANACASFLNNLEAPPRLGGSRVIARVIHSKGGE